MKKGFLVEKFLAYHGSGTKIDRFEFVFTNKGVDQLGSGFYFTTSMEEAIGYTSARSSVLPDGPKLGGEDSPTVHVVELSISNPLDSTSVQGISASQALAIIKKSPCLEDCLWDWEDLSSVSIDDAARRAAKTYETRDGDTRLIRRLNNLATDFFPGAKGVEVFNRAVQEVLGYDGVVCNEFSGKIHWVAWFPDQIRIVDWIAMDKPETSESLIPKRQSRCR